MRNKDDRGIIIKSKYRIFMPLILRLLVYIHTWVPAIMAPFSGWAAHAVTTSESGTYVFCFCRPFILLPCESSLRAKKKNMSIKTSLSGFHQNCTIRFVHSFSCPFTNYYRRIRSQPERSEMLSENQKH